MTFGGGNGDDVGNSEMVLRSSLLGMIEAAREGSRVIVPFSDRV